MKGDQQIFNNRKAYLGWDGEYILFIKTTFMALTKEDRLHSKP